jgi:hypothetical protein
MATIRVPLRDRESEPKKCEGKAPPRRSGTILEFTDATEEQLAFWNALSDEEKGELADKLHRNCFFDELDGMIKKEQEKQEELDEREERLAGGGEGANQPGPSSPPREPPEPPLGPPIQHGDS